MYWKKITFQFTLSSANADHQNCNTLSFKGRRDPLSGKELVLVYFRFDHGDIENEFLRTDTCNSGTLALQICTPDEISKQLPVCLIGASNKSFSGANRVRFQLTLANGERPVLDINLTDPPLKKFLDGCPGMSVLKE